MVHPILLGSTGHTRKSQFRCFDYIYMSVEIIEWPPPLPQTTRIMYDDLHNNDR